MGVATGLNTHVTSPKTTQEHYPTGNTGLLPKSRNTGLVMEYRASNWTTADRANKRITEYMLWGESPFHILLLLDVGTPDLVIAAQEAVIHAQDKVQYGLVKRAAEEAAEQAAKKEQVRLRKQAAEQAAKKAQTILRKKNKKCRREAERLRKEAEKHEKKLRKEAEKHEKKLKKEAKKHEKKLRKEAEKHEKKLKKEAKKHEKKLKKEAERAGEAAHQAAKAYRSARQELDQVRSVVVTALFVTLVAVRLSL